MKRIAIVGPGHRAGKFIDELAERHRESAALAAFCDINPVQAEAQNRWLEQRHHLKPLPWYPIDAFEAMIAKERIDTVIVCTIDRVHHEFILRGLAAGCHVITEKPMTTDAGKCRAILEASRAHPGRLRVAFNYRWAPSNSLVKEQLEAGAIGNVKSVLLEWLLDIKHGADYFRRWHSEKANSGGLLVHKATHHFDLVNWWIDSIPESVFAQGDLAFYGKANATARGDGKWTGYSRYTGSPAAKDDPFRLDLSEHARFKALYLDAEAQSGYIRDRNVFREGITIEDSLSVLVRYRTGALLTYALNAFSPREGMRVVFNGDRGRLEYELFAKSTPSKAENDEGHAPGHNGTGLEASYIRVLPHFGTPYSLPVNVSGGGHWGADPLMIGNLFSEDAADPLGRTAGPEQGAASVLVGISANRSLETRNPVALESVLPLAPQHRHLSDLS